MRQHVTAVEAACIISGAECSGLAVGSSELIFRPGKVAGGSYHFAVGTAGSTGLVLQTVLMPLVMAKSPSQLVLEGGTHNIMAPPFDFIERTFLPLINRMGPTVTARIVRHGFYPRGGGRIEIDITPAPLRRIDCMERGSLLAVSGQAVLAGVPAEIAERILARAKKDLFHWPDDAFAVRELPAEQGPGVILMLEAQYANVVEVVSGFGRLGVPAERLAKTAAAQMKGYIDVSAFAGPYLADQLILPFVLSGGGSFTMVKPKGGGKPRRTEWDAILPGFGTRYYATGRKVHIVQMEADGHMTTVTIGNAAAISRKQARDIARRVKLRAQAGDNPAQERKVKRATLTFANFLALYFDRVGPSWKPSTHRTHHLYRVQHLDRAFVGQHLDEITKAEVQRWFVGVSDRSGPGAANRTLAILRAAFNKAEKWGMRAEGSNPCTGIKPNRPRKFERFLSDAEIGRLGAALRRHEAQCPGPVAIIRLLLLTGCRYSEIAELTWGEVVRGRIRLHDSKTGARTVWLGAEAHDLLRALPRGKPTDSIFINPRAKRPFLSLGNHWLSIRSDAGLGTLRLHDLRHSFASHAAAASETLPMIGKLLGHARVDTTARYAHLDDGQLLDVAERIGVLIKKAMGVLVA